MFFLVKYTHMGKKAVWHSSNLLHYLTIEEGFLGKYNTHMGKEAMWHSSNLLHGGGEGRGGGLGP